MSKIITVYGSDGGGKTTLAVNIAAALANKDSLVGIVSTDCRYPSLQTFLGVKIENDTGMVQIHTSTKKNIDYEQQFLNHPTYKNLFICSVPNSTTCLTFASEDDMDDDKMVQNFLVRMKTSSFDYVIIDCENDPNNMLSSFALYYADVIINVTDATIQGINFHEAYSEFISKMRNSKNNVPILEVLNKDLNFLDVSKIESVLNIKFTEVIPFDKYIIQAQNNGAPFVVNYPSGIGAKTSKVLKSFNHLLTLIDSPGDEVMLDG